MGHKKQYINPELLNLLQKRGDGAYIFRCKSCMHLDLFTFKQPKPTSTLCSKCGQEMEEIETTCDAPFDENCPNCQFCRYGLWVGNHLHELNNLTNTL